MTLDKLEKGRNATVTKVNGEGMLRLRLLDMGLTPGTRISITKIAPSGDPIRLTVRGYELTMRKEDAASIEISTEGIE